MLPAVTRVTLLPKHSPVYLHLNWMYLCPCVTCRYPCYPVIQTQSSKFAFKLDVFVSLCYLRLPLLPKHSLVNLQFKLKYLFPYVTCGYPVTQTQPRIFAFPLDAFASLCYLRLPVLPCYPNTVQYTCNLS